MSSVTVKLDLGGDLRRLRLENPDFTVANIRLRLADLYALAPEAVATATLKYRDEDGDFITIVSDSDLQEAMLVTTTTTATTAPARALRILVVVPNNYNTSPSVPAATAATATTPSVTAAPTASAAHAALARAANLAATEEARRTFSAAATAVEDARRTANAAAADARRTANAAHAAHTAQVAANAAVAAAAAGPHGASTPFPDYPPYNHHASSSTGAQAPHVSTPISYPADPRPDVTTGIPEVDHFINALGGLESFLPSFLAMLGVPGAGVHAGVGGFGASVATGANVGAAPQPESGTAGSGTPAGAASGPGVNTASRETPQSMPFRPAPFPPGPLPHAFPMPPPFGPLHGPGPYMHPYPHHPFHQHHPHSRAYAHADVHFRSHPSRGRGGFGRGRGGRRGGSYTWADTDGMGMGQFCQFDQFAPFMTGMFGNMTERFQGISDQTKQAFKDLVSTIARSGNHFAALAAGRVAFPVAKEWLQNQLGDSGALGEPAISALIESITPIISPHLGEELTGRVTGFLRIALVDNAVLDLLRSIDSGDLPEDMDVDVDIDLGSIFGGRPRGEHGGHLFDVHVGIECDGCGKAPIVGSRFKCDVCPNYDLCSSCKTDGKHPEHTFKEFKFPWEASNDAVVPPSPLSINDRSPHVAHLQKILTELGYMNEGMYSRRVGYFGPNTRAALRLFQREYGLEQNVVLGMYDDLTRGALLSIIDSGTTARAGQDEREEEGDSAAATSAQEATA